MGNAYSAVVAEVGGDGFVVAVGLTVRQAHAEVRRRNADSPGTKHVIVFDAGYEAGQDYAVGESEVAA